MPRQAPRSLRYEYELYIENEVEEYKDSISRTTLLKIGDEAVAALREQPQLTLTELIVCEEVDRIIRSRMRLPSYNAWRRKRLKLLAEFQRPEHWGLQPDGILAREVAPPAQSRVVVAGCDGEGAALYLAARGCDVVAVDSAADAVARVIRAAEEAGLTERVHGCISDLRLWSPDGALSAFVCSPAALHGLSAAEHVQLLLTVQGATRDGGVHLLERSAADEGIVSLSELSARYEGWAISVERESEHATTFLARKSVA